MPLRAITAPQPYRNPVACSVSLHASAPIHAVAGSGGCASQHCADEGCAIGGSTNPASAQGGSVLEGASRGSSAMGLCLLPPEQLPRGSLPINGKHPESADDTALQRAAGRLPVGTIILPASHTLPPGSLVLSQGASTEGPMCLALPSQLTGHLLSQVPDHLPCQLPTQVPATLPAASLAAPSLVKLLPAQSLASANPRRRHKVTHRHSHRPLSHVLEQTTGPNPSGPMTVTDSNDDGGASQPVGHVSLLESCQQTSTALEDGMGRCSSSLLELAEEAVSLAASEGGSMQGSTLSLKSLASVLSLCSYTTWSICLQFFGACMSVRARVCASECCMLCNPGT